MRRSLAVCMVLLLWGCASQGRGPSATIDDETNPAQSDGAVTFSGGSGESADDPVIIKAPNSSVGIPAEYQWLREHFPGHEVQGQALVGLDKGMADVITIRTKDGETKDIYFDITSFFGRF